MHRDVYLKPQINNCKYVSLLPDPGIMVRGAPRPLQSASQKEKQSPEDSSMTKDGTFKEYNTVAPKSKSVHALFSLRGRVAIISGGDRGIGLNVAEALAEAGADVAIWFNSNMKAHDRAKDIEKEYGVKCTSKSLKLSSEYGC